MTKFLLVVIWIIAAPALADIIQLKTPSYGAATIFSGPFGQTFTATVNEPQSKIISFMWAHSVNAQQDVTITGNVLRAYPRTSEMLSVQAQNR
jgi:hypothetical protein